MTDNNDKNVAESPSSDVPNIPNVQNDPKKLSLMELMANINKNLEELKPTGKVKKWKLPFKARVGKAKAKKNWIGALFINENKHIEPCKLPIDEGIIEKDGVPHLATTNYVLYLKNKPLLIIPKWSVEPFCPEKNYDESVDKKTLSAGFKLLANHLEKGQLDLKKKMGFAPLIIILILAGVGYFLYKSGAFT